MKSLTLHAIDDQLSAQIRRRAAELSISMNELAKRVLAEGMDIKAPAEPPHRKSFESFCGSWTEDQARDFEARVVDMDKVNPEEWR